MIGSSSRGDAGSPMMTRAPVGRASSSSGWLPSGSITTMLRGLRAVLASRLSRGMVSGSRPVTMVASRTNRDRSRSSGCRHSTDATVSAPISVAPRQTGPPSWKASGSGWRHRAQGEGGRVAHVQVEHPAGHGAGRLARPGTGSARNW